MRQVLSTLSMLLGVEEPKLESMLTQKVVVTRGEVFIKQRGMQDANLTRDAIVKSLYEVRKDVILTLVRHIISCIFHMTHGILRNYVFDRERCTYTSCTLSRKSASSLERGFV